MCIMCMWNSCNQTWKYREDGIGWDSKHKIVTRDGVSLFAFKTHYCATAKVRVSVQGVKSLGSHFACLCRGFDFYEVKKKNKKFLFQKENGNTIALFIIFLVKSLQKEQKAQIMEYKPQSAGINLQSPQSDSTSRRLTLIIWVSKDPKALSPRQLVNAP